MKILQISDIHVRNYKYHHEYKAVFNELYEKAKELEPDIIVNTGDTFHTKSKISPEAYQMVSDLFRNLADIAPLHVILGNHDTNVKNASRLDSVSPIIEALSHDNIHYHKNTCEVQFPKHNVSLCVMSILDPDNWYHPVNKETTNIILYHGAVQGSKTDAGWTMEHGEISLDFLQEFDYALLGDIHKTNQILDDKGKARYPGSLICQNFGETNDKGFLFWDIKDKDAYTCDHHKLTNPKPFVSIKLTKDGRLPYKVMPPKNARLRLVAETRLSLDVIRRSLAAAKYKYKPEIVTFLNRTNSDRINVEGEVSSILNKNLREVGTQEKLIQKYLQDYNVGQETLNEVFTLNKKYNLLAKQSEETQRNISWKIKRFKWDNLFNYGSGNYINFENLSGIVGIFGKNYSGKSSVVNALLYTLFNSTAKNIRKNYNVINEHRDIGSGEVEIEIGSKVYKIIRTSEKYTKKLKGKVTQEAKTEVNFSVYDSSTGETSILNSIDRNSTDREIRKILGTMEDFLLTSVMPQMSALKFINEGSTKRKEILAKFLDLELFEQKFRLAHEVAAETKALLRKLEGNDYDTEIKATMLKLAKNEVRTASKKAACGALADSTIDLEAELAETLKKIESIPEESIDIDSVTADRDNLFQEIVTKKEINEMVQGQISQSESFVANAIEFMETFDIQSFRDKIAEGQEKNDELSDVQVALTDKKKTFVIYDRRKKILEGIPCGSSYLSTCKFIKDAYKSSKQLDELARMIKSLQAESEMIAKDIFGLNTEMATKMVANYNTLVENQKEHESSIVKNQLRIEQTINEINSSELTLAEFDQKIQYYNDNKDAIENHHKLDKQKKKITKQIGEQKAELKLCEEAILELYKTHGSLEERIKNSKEQKEELERLRVEHSASDLFMRCMHSNGIAFDIIKKALPHVNDEISKVLANIVEFRVFFETDGNKLDIYIQHPKHQPKPLENGSGAEKTLAAMAIRIAILSVSNMPKCNVLILDEPGSALDEEHLESFSRIIEMLKGYFDICMIITHVGSLKDIVDREILIDKKRGFALVRE
tara:strand:+ start:81 stop:3239 length:3159 start_codon:yes stop_codon:yes gene_type:complete